jgi:hypothetical protein
MSVPETGTKICPVHHIPMIAENLSELGIEWECEQCEKDLAKQRRKAARIRQKGQKKLSEIFPENQPEAASP